MSPGPVTAYVVKTGARGGFSGAWRVGLGAATVDAAYCLLAVVGVASWIIGLDAGRTAMLVVGGLVLTYLGLTSIQEGLRGSAPGSGSDRRFRVGPYRTGIIMTVFNPFTVAFWAAAGTAVFGAGSDFSAALAGAFALAVFAGSALWFTVLAAVVHAGRRLAAANVLRWLELAAGVLLLFFAASLFVRAAV